MTTPERKIDELESALGRLLIRFHDRSKEIEFLTTRVDVLEHFIRMQYPEYFAGEVGTKVDPELHPIPIVYGAPQEQATEHADGSVTWETRHKDGSVTQETIRYGEQRDKE